MVCVGFSPIWTVQHGIQFPKTLPCASREKWCLSRGIRTAVTMPAIPNTFPTRDPSRQERRLFELLSPPMQAVVNLPTLTPSYRAIHGMHRACLKADSRINQRNEIILDAVSARQRAQVCCSKLSIVRTSPVPQEAFQVSVLEAVPPQVSSHTSFADGLPHFPSARSSTVTTLLYACIQKYQRHKPHSTSAR